MLGKVGFGGLNYHERTTTKGVSLMHIQGPEIGSGWHDALHFGCGNGVRWSRRIPRKSQSI